MPDALDRKLAELEHRLLAGHEQIGRGVGVPFLLLLHPPSEELRVCRDVNSLVAKLRTEGLQVEVIDCNQVLLDYLHRAEELQRAIRAEKRNPSALKEFGIGEVLAEALVERVITAQQQMSGPGVVVLTRVGALHPFLLPNIVQERLAGRRVHVPIVFLGPAEDDSGSDYLFLGVGTPLPGHVSLGRLDLGDTAMQIGQLFLADIGRDINPVVKVADYTEAELQNELEDYVVTEVVEKYLLDFLEHYTDTRQKQTDRVGVWISGYVGSGKSHFAKLLGLLTTNPQVVGHTAIERFRPRLATCRQAREIERYLYEVATFLHTEVIGFQIDAVAIKGQQDDICNLLYRQFLAHRGLSTDLRIALLIEEPLIERDCLDIYRQAVQELTGKAWEDIRHGPVRS